MPHYASGSLFIYASQRAQWYNPVITILFKRPHYIEGVFVLSKKLFKPPSFSSSNKPMESAPSPQNEAERLASLKRLHILDTQPEERFDRITRFATKIFDVPISTITLIDSNREWFKSVCGLNTQEGDRLVSFCGHAMLVDEILIIRDTKEDKRFSDNPMVVGKPFIRFYAGVPLFAVDGQRIGTLCLKDIKPRDFSTEEIKTLKSLARWAELEINNRDLALAIESVKRSTLELDSFFNLSKDLMCVANADGYFKRVNPVFLGALGYTPSEMLGEPILNFVVPEDIEVTKKVLKNITNGEVVVDFKNRFIKKDGMRIWLQWNAVPEGEHFYAVARDVTSDVEKQIQSKFYTSILQNSNDAIISEDLNGVVTSWNEAAEMMYGYSSEEMIGKPVNLVIPEGYDDVEQRLDSIKNGVAIGNFETLRKRKNGTLFNVSLSVSPITSDDSNRVIGASIIARDITREKEIDLEKTEFVSLASHQLKTPVGAIGWNLEMLQGGDYGLLSPRQKESVVDMYKLNRRMNELINGLLNISRIEMGMFVVDLVPTNWGSVCDEVILELEPQILLKKQSLSKGYSDNLEAIPADPKLLRVILQNYISNAVKYTPDEGRISVTLDSSDGSLIIKVSNTGDPIPDKDKSKIFSKLFRASDAQKRDPDGNGLGLYMVRKITESCGGRVWFESEKGEDTVFYASFPHEGMSRKGVGVFKDGNH